MGRSSIVQDHMTTRKNRRIFAVLYSSAGVGFWTVVVLVSARIEYALVLFLPFSWICELLLEARWPRDRFRRARSKGQYELARALYSMCQVLGGIGVLFGVAAISIGGGRGMEPVVVGAAAMIIALATWWGLRRHRAGAGSEGAAEPGT